MSSKLNIRIRNIALALAVAIGAAGALASPALAADWGNHGRYEQHWRYHHPHRMAYAQPYGYVVAPPPVVAAAPVPSFNLVVPLTIR